MLNDRYRAMRLEAGYNDDKNRGNKKHMAASLHSVPEQLLVVGKLQQGPART